jgi:hypothetical protein
MSDKISEELFEMIGRCRKAGEGSRAAAVVGKECQMIVSNNPDRKCKATSVTGRVSIKLRRLQTLLTQGFFEFNVSQNWISGCFWFTIIANKKNTYSRTFLH